GDALARLGREREAEAEFRNELAQFPDNTEAARRLVLLLVAQGRNDDATRVIRSLADASPTSRTFAAIAETLRIVGDTDGARYWSARSRGTS
ncbi:MAG TPA: tetratricopeptide repeat protein, partial [Thermoanaerobaculia bacterium]|nr:tetratricopeptide repeat protein [Thermoanaerobaculia bacterium]